MDHWPTRWRGALVVTVSEGRPFAVVHMPAGSLAPFTMSVGFLVLFAALIVDHVRQHGGRRGHHRRRAGVVVLAPGHRDRGDGGARPGPTTSFRWRRSGRRRADSGAPRVRADPRDRARHVRGELLLSRRQRRAAARRQSGRAVRAAGARDRAAAAGVAARDCRDSWRSGGAAGRRRGSASPPRSRPPAFTSACSSPPGETADWHPPATRGTRPSPDVAGFHAVVSGHPAGDAGGLGDLVLGAPGRRPRSRDGRGTPGWSTGSRSRARWSCSAPCTWSHGWDERRMSQGETEVRLGPGGAPTGRLLFGLRRRRGRLDAAFPRQLRARLHRLRRGLERYPDGAGGRHRAARPVSRAWSTLSRWQDWRRVSAGQPLGRGAERAARLVRVSHARRRAARRRWRPRRSSSKASPRWRCRRADGTCDDHADARTRAARRPHGLPRRTRRIGRTVGGDDRRRSGSRRGGDREIRAADRVT